MSYEIINFGNYKDGYKVPIESTKNTNDTYSLSIREKVEALPLSSNVIAIQRLNKILLYKAY